MSRGIANGTSGTTSTGSEPMAETFADRLTAGYLDRLRHAAAGLPPAVREELVADISAHLADAAAHAPDEAALRQACDDLGTPEEVAAAAAAESGTHPPARTGGELGYDVATVLALLLGGFVVPFLGWVAGVVMIWNGPRWTTGGRWLGTLIWPAAIVVGMAGLVADHAASGHLTWAVLLAAVIIVAGIPAGFIHLLRTASRAGSRAGGAA